MSHSIQCVHCQAVLKSSGPVPAGKRVRCPKCQQSFTTPSDELQPARTYIVECTHCMAVLKSSAPVPAETKLKCPKCQQSFMTPAAEPPPPSPAPAPAPMAADMNRSIFHGDGNAAIAGLAAEYGIDVKALATTPQAAPAPPAGLNMSIFTGDGDAAIARLAAEYGIQQEPEMTFPLCDDDLVAPDEDAPSGKKLAGREPSKKS